MSPMLRFFGSLPGTNGRMDPWAINVRESLALRSARERRGTPKPYRRTSISRFRLPPAPRRWPCMARVHSAECTINPRTVSGHSGGYWALMIAAMRAAWAVAALVA